MTIRDRQLKPRLACKKKILERRSSSLLQPPPLVDRHQDGGLNTPLRDYLRTLRNAFFQQLAKSGLCFLHRPTHCRNPVYG